MATGCPSLILDLLNASVAAVTMSGAKWCFKADNSPPTPVRSCTHVTCPMPLGASGRSGNGAFTDQFSASLSACSIDSNRELELVIDDCRRSRLLTVRVTYHLSDHKPTCRKCAFSELDWITSVDYDTDLSTLAVVRTGDTTRVCDSHMQCASAWSCVDDYLSGPNRSHYPIACRHTGDSVGCQG